ncbi:hypothetical protein E3P99_01475 [Wallemia hederae]|uniref:ADP-ribosylation factor-like protein 2 n=1 Tax=Wallemia hederae TaxID=1540922 RepID=A0A4T0FQ25_9BASI|nr:hypothetical protein E3P99_01475 [Wallemia hederae]
MPYRAGIYPSRSVLLLPLSVIPVVAYSYNVLMPPVIMAIVAFCSTVTLIPLSSQHLVRAGLRGRDLLKPYKQLVPESLGIVPACVLIVLLFVFTPVSFAQHLKTYASNLQPQFPHNKLSTYLSAVLSLQTATLLGFLDDLFDIRWRYKLPIPLIASIPMLVVYFAEGGITDVVIPIPLRQYFGKVVHLGPLYYIYMAMLSTFCTNSINILAGINGIEVGQAIVIAMSVVVNDLLHLPLPLSDRVLQHLPAWVGAWAMNGLVGPTTVEQAERHLFSLYFMLPLIGASLALLYHNWYPARVFPGDTFCYFAGMAFAIVGVLAHFSKTLLLFFIPQIFNFVFSTPQLFGLVPCPRHRVPRYIHASNKLEPSVALFEREPLFFVSLPLKILSALNLVQLEKDGEGRVRSTTNLTLLNALLCFFGSMDERTLAIVTLAVQVACSAAAFGTSLTITKIPPASICAPIRGQRVWVGDYTRCAALTRDAAMVTSKWKLAASYGSDWIICAVLLGLLYLINNVHGYWREFDVNDTAIRHTHAVDERVPMTLLGVIIGLVPIICLCVLSTQWYRSYTDLHHSLLGFLLTAALTISTTTAVKVLAGRPRPDLIDRCRPAAGSVNADVGLSTAAICTQTDFDLLQDGFRSFPSGHSSSSFALLGYFSFYLAGKMQVFDTKGHTIKSWICWTPWIGAVLIAVSRTMDYRHHPTDVIAGAVIGTFFAYVCYRQYYPHLGQALSHKPHNSRFIEAKDAYRLPTHQTEGYGLDRMSQEPQPPQQTHNATHTYEGDQGAHRGGYQGGYQGMDEVHLNGANGKTATYDAGLCALGFLIHVVCQVQFQPIEILLQCVYPAELLAQLYALLPNASYCLAAYPPLNPPTGLLGLTGDDITVTREGDEERERGNAMILDSLLSSKADLILPSLFVHLRPSALSMGERDATTYTQSDSTQGLLTIIRKQRYKSREMRFLFLGLDNAGKTTIMKRVNGEDIRSISPTLGFNIKTFVHRGYTLNVWDVGGQRTLRPYWRNYFEQNDAIVWVVDSSDRMRMEDCRVELFDLLSEDRLAGATVLIFANKQDISGAMTPQTLQLDTIKSHTWKIQSCSAVTGENLLQGLDWAVADCSKRLYYSSQPDFSSTNKDLPKLFGGDDEVKEDVA